IRPPPTSPLFPYTTPFRSIDMKFGSGEISGTFWVVVNSVATNLTDAAELVVMTGSFTGHVQVRDLPTGRIIEILPGSVFKQEMRSEEHTSELQSRFDLVCR